MIIKEDTPMGSNLWVVLPTAASSSSQQLIHPDDEDEAIPGYRPPSVPPPVRLSTADPEPWRTGEPPPRYKFRKRPWRYLPLAASIIFSGILLGGCVNFMVESIILISQSPIRKPLLDAFRALLLPANILIGAAVVSLVLLPLHQVLPLPPPGSPTPFMKCRLREQILGVLRVVIPGLVVVLHCVGTGWYLGVALKKAGPDENPKDNMIPIGNGGEIPFERDTHQIYLLWLPWFYHDPNVKFVVFTSILSTFASIFFLLNALPHNPVYRAFAGEPPKWFSRLERRVSRWTGQTRGGGVYGDALEGGEEMEEIMLQQGEEGRAGGRGRWPRPGVFARRIGEEGSLGRLLRGTTGGGRRRIAI